MCNLCIANPPVISFREVPIKFLNKLQDEVSLTTAASDKLVQNGRTWLEFSDSYECHVKYLYWSGYDWVMDTFVFQFVK